MYRYQRIYNSLIQVSSRCPCTWCAHRAAFPLALRFSVCCTVVALLFLWFYNSSPHNVSPSLPLVVHLPSPRSLCSAYYQVDELADAHDSGPVSVGMHATSRNSALSSATVMPSPGRCPPSPALCGLRDLFDEIVVIVLPRLARRFARITAQLVALGVPFTCVQGRDARAGGMAAVAEAFMAERKEATAGVLALALTHLAVLDYFARAPETVQRILLLEDDVILHADFPRVLNERVRRLPDVAADWRLLFLGATLFPSENGLSQINEQGIVAAGPGVEIYSAFAVGIHREAAALIARTMAQNRTPIDVAPYRAAQAAWPQQVAALWPPVALAPPFAESALGHAQDLDAADWARRSGFEARMFDLERGYYAGGEAGNAPRCEVVDGSGGDGGGRVESQGRVMSSPSVRPYTRVAAESADACCAQCLRHWPRCRAWAWAAGGPAWMQRRDTAKKDCELATGIWQVPALQEGFREGMGYTRADLVACVFEDDVKAHKNPHYNHNFVNRAVSISQLMTTWLSGPSL